MNITGMRIEHFGEFGNLWHFILTIEYRKMEVSDRIIRRRQLARQRYDAMLEKHNRELIERMLLANPSPEIETMLHGLLATNEYRRLDQRTKMTLFRLMPNFP